MCCYCCRCCVVDVICGVWWHGLFEPPRVCVLVFVIVDVVVGDSSWMQFRVGSTWSNDEDEMKWMSSSVFCVFWCFCSVLLCVVVIGGVEEVRKVQILNWIELNFYWQQLLQPYCRFAKQHKPTPLGSWNKRERKKSQQQNRSKKLIYMSLILRTWFKK